MPASPTIKKALFAAVALAALGGGLYWRHRSPPTPADPVAADPEAIPLARRDLAALGPLSPGDRQVLERAEQLIQRNQLRDALDVLNRFQDRDDRPTHHRALLYVGYCHLRLGELAEAESAFATVAEKRPTEPDAHRGLADVYEFLGASSRAADHLRKVAELDPADARPYRQLASSFLMMKLFAPAEEAAREGLKRNPMAETAPRLRIDLAEALLGQKRFEEALAAAAGIDSPTARAIRAECLRMTNHPADAAREVEAGLASTAVEKAGAVGITGRNFSVQERAASRVVEMEGEAGRSGRLGEHSTGSPDPMVRTRLHVEHGWLRADARDDAGAVKAFEAALKDDPFNQTARLQLALALRRLGQAARADAEDATFKDTEARLKLVTELNQAAIEKPWDAAVRRELAAACRKLNLTAMAEHWLRAAAACEAAGK